MRRALRFLALTAFVAACGTDDPIAEEFSAMSRNVYVGADFTPILTAPTPADLVAAVELTYQTILAANFPERAGRLAAEIVAKSPDVVGLQEITLLRTQSPGDAAVGGTVPAADTLQDYLTLLLDSLAAQGANYQLAAKVENWDLEMPRPNGDDARLTDYDVILVRSGIPTSNVATGQYSTHLTIPLTTGQIVDINRGWAAVDVTIGTRSFRVVNTHLESDGVGTRLGQAVELTDMLAAETGPVLIIGDLNSDAIAGTDPTYPKFIDTGYEDLWSVSLGTGLSCCHAPLLDNAASTFTERIDFVMSRNVTIESVTGEVLGDEAADKTTGGLWPSDHGGVFFRATVR